ncbi:hypothetical protein RND81_02G230500 [Saponaria officinalis]|uniref:CCHC-type domain-containing protein n=1 Tax=Saponaria officinalis TaxID=3572 RepID=A0AAW1MY73_SAPOF
MSSLLAHEARARKFFPMVEEKAFSVKRVSSAKGKTNNAGRGNGRGGILGRGRGGGRERGQGRSIQCRCCKKYGHKKADCWFKQNDEQKANFAEKADDESKLFMAHSPFNEPADGVWFVDSGCNTPILNGQNLT